MQNQNEPVALIPPMQALQGLINYMNSPVFSKEEKQSYLTNYNTRHGCHFELKL